MKQGARRNLELHDLRGVWRSHDYGILLEIGGARYRLIEETGVSRIPVFEARLDELREFYTDVEISPKGRAFSARRSAGVTRIRFRRLKGLPPLDPAPEAGGGSDPHRVFDVLWQTFAERYALFDLRGIDWQEVRRHHRPRVRPDTGARRLFEVLTEMLAPLRDGHVELLAPFRRFNAHAPLPVHQRLATELREGGHDKSLQAYLRELRNERRSTIGDRYLRTPPKTACRSLFQWGALSDRAGYLAVRAMAGLSGEPNHPRADQRAAADAMERMLADLGHLPSLVLDLRENGGGWDGVALRIAGYFVDRRRLAFTKAANRGDLFGGRQPVMIEPRGRRRYRGRLFLLTSGLTASAAEIFVLALLQRPRLTRIGEATQGILSDAMERHLPNGWRFTLSNELYSAFDGSLYEDRGIPPHVEFPFLHRRARTRQRDPMLDWVLEQTGT